MKIYHYIFQLNVFVKMVKVEYEILLKEKFILLGYSKSNLAARRWRLISTWILRDIRIETAWGLEDLP